MTKVAYEGPRRRIDPNIKGTFCIFKILAGFLSLLIKDKLVESRRQFKCWKTEKQFFKMSKIRNFSVTSKLHSTLWWSNISRFPLTSDIINLKKYKSFFFFFSIYWWKIWTDFCHNFDLVPWQSKWIFLIVVGWWLKFSTDSVAIAHSGFIKYNWFFKI